MQRDPSGNSNNVRLYRESSSKIVTPTVFQSFCCRQGVISHDAPGQFSLCRSRNKPRVSDAGWELTPLQSLTDREEKKGLVVGLLLHVSSVSGVSRCYHNKVLGVILKGGRKISSSTTASLTGHRDKRTAANITINVFLFFFVVVVVPVIITL